MEPLNPNLHTGHQQSLRQPTPTLNSRLLSITSLFYLVMEQTCWGMEARKLLMGAYTQGDSATETLHPINFWLLFNSI